MSDGDSLSNANASKAPTGRRRDYIPSADPGSRLPHMNMRLLSNLSNKVSVGHFLLSSYICACVCWCAL